MRRKKNPKPKPSSSVPDSETPVETAASPAAEPAAVSPALKHLQVRLQAVRRSHRRATVSTAACAVLGTLLAWLTIECTLDYLAMLRWGLRLGILVVALAACGALV